MLLSERKKRTFLLHSQNSNGPYSAFVWSSMPAELRPNWKRKANAAEVRQKKMKVVNVEETLKALEQKEISRKRKEIDVHAIKEEAKSDNENDGVNTFQFNAISKYRQVRKYLKKIVFSRRMSKMKNKTMKWTRTTITVSVILTMATITMMKMIIWTTVLFIKLRITLFMPKISNKMYFSYVNMFLCSRNSRRF